MFTLSASKVSLTVGDTELLTSGAQNIYLCQFSFDSEWDGLTKIAVFKAGSANISVYIDSNNQCQIPYEVLEKPSLPLNVGVYGTKDGNVVMPTIMASLGNIQRGASMGTQAKPPPSSLYNEILTASKNAVSIAESVRKDADAGVFNGKDGEQGERGADGYTPQKYVDYWTAEDQADMVQLVLAALPDGDEVYY